MNETIKKFRELLDELESSTPSVEPSFKESFQLFELPEIVRDIVDYLQPALQPYEAAIYWHMFRHSIIATGDVFVRVSTRGRQKNVIISFRSNQSTGLAPTTVRETLSGLVTKGAISLAGDTNRAGTPYRVHYRRKSPSATRQCQRLRRSNCRRLIPSESLISTTSKRTA